MLVGWLAGWLVGCLGLGLVINVVAKEKHKGGTDSAFVFGFGLLFVFLGLALGLWGIVCTDFWLYTKGINNKIPSVTGGNK